MSGEQDSDRWDGNSVLPVSVIVADSGQGGVEHRWRIMGVVVGQRFASDEVRSVRLRSGPEGEITMWTGFRLRLHHASVEDYALNVNSPAPKAFVVARVDAQGLRPLQVTVSLDEAQNLDATELRDSREQVFQVGMPPEVYRWVEHFVLDNYVPRKRKGKGRGKRRSKALFDAEVGDYAGDEV